MSYKFSLPVYDDLNPRQKRAVTDEGSVAITGGPGTGKSVVSVWRHMINFRRKRRKSILLTFTKSLRYFLAESIRSYRDPEDDEIKKQGTNQSAVHVSLANSWDRTNFDEIIIDEAQDLPENELVTLYNPINNFDKIVKPINGFQPPIDGYDTGDKYQYNGIEYKVKRWRRGYLKYITHNAQIVSYGADNNQIVYPERATTEERLKELFPDANTHKLFQNYRNTYCILNFARLALNYNIDNSTLERLKEENYGREPILKLTENIEQQKDAIWDIIYEFNDGETNIAILLFFKNQFDSIITFLANKKITKSGKEFTFSKYYSKSDSFDNIDNVHLTTFKSAKGLEFDVVIIPEFDRYQTLINNLHYPVNSEDYYVAFTRARRNLFLIGNTDVSVSTNVLKREHFNSTNIKNIVNDNTPPSDDLPF